MKESGDFTVTHRAVLAVALPMTAAHMTTPLLGAVDAGVIGRLGQAHLLAAVAMGAVIFDFVFWIFGSLRMGTIGLAAQARGAGDTLELRATLIRALVLAGGCGLAIVLLQWPIREAALTLMGGSAAVTAAARDYFDVRIWSAPFTFTNYVVLGWLIGTGRTAQGLALQIGINLFNMALTVLLVLGFGLGVEGAALGTLLAEIIGAGIGVAMCGRHMGWRADVPRAVVLARAQMIRTLAVNRDIMIRSAALLAAFATFTSFGARAGDVTLAANAVLMNLFMLAAYFLDGFATAAEQLGGRAVGARRRDLFTRAVNLSLLWGFAVSLVVTLLAWTGGGAFIDLMSTNEEVRDYARVYLVYAALTPLLGVAAFVFDGTYIGATWTRDMRNFMLGALAVYLAALYALAGFGNHGLWWALLIFLAVRGLTLGLRYPALTRKTFLAQPARDEARVPTSPATPA
jgi:MATE family multidrug resistance protein